MTTVDLISPKGTKEGTVELPAEIFDVQTNVPLIHQVVVAQLAALDLVGLGGGRRALLGEELLHLLDVLDRLVVLEDQERRDE